MIASVAPLVATQVPSGTGCSVDMRRRDSSKAISATLGVAASMSSRRTPRLPANARSADSVGSPVAVHVPAASAGAWSVASLHAAATLAIRSRYGSDSGSGSGSPIPSNAPNGA